MQFKIFIFLSRSQKPTFAVCLPNNSYFNIKLNRELSFTNKALHLKMVITLIL